MTSPPSPPNRRRRRKPTQNRVLQAGLFLVVVFVWLLIYPPASSRGFYALVEPHPRLCQVVRIPFWLVGKGAEFDTEIDQAMTNRILSKMWMESEKSTLVLPSVDE